MLELQVSKKNDDSSIQHVGLITFFKILSEKIFWAPDQGYV